MSHPRARAAATLGIMLAAGLASQCVCAQFGDCEGVAASGYKVLLDQIVGAQATSAPADVQLFRGQVRSAVAGKIEELKLETDSAIALILCDRSPTSSSAFTHDRVDALDTRDVLLEIWGATGRATDDAGTTSARSASTSLSFRYVSR